MSADRVATWIGIATVLASVIASWAVLSERSDNARGVLVEHANRLTAIERDGSVGAKLIEMDRKIDKLQWYVEYLQQNQQAQKKGSK